MPLCALPALVRADHISLERIRWRREIRFDSSARGATRHTYAPGKMFTARAAINATVINEITDCTMKSTFTHRDKGIVSVGENAVEFVYDTNR